MRQVRPARKLRGKSRISTELRRISVRKTLKQGYEVKLERFPPECEEDRQNYTIEDVKDDR